MTKYPVSISRDACRDATIRIVSVYIDGIKIHDFRKGNRIVVQLEPGHHQIVFAIGKKEIKRSTFFVGTDGDGATIVFFIKSNTWKTVIETELANTFIQICEHADAPTNTDSGLGCFGSLIAALMVLLGIFLFMSGIFDIIG